MKFNFRDLDANMRALMKKEIVTATENDEIYFSTRFNTIGSGGWVEWLIEAAEFNDEHWLAYKIELSGGMKDFEGRAKPTGGYSLAHVPHTAAEIMAEGQFNRFYIAAVCQCAIKTGQRHVTIYRARHRGDPRSESTALEGTTMDALELLKQVRSKQEAFRCALLKPSSGLSVHL